MAELFRFVSLRGPAPLAQATLPFVVPLRASTKGPLELSDALDAVVEWSAARGWAISIAELDRFLDKSFDGLTLERLANGDTRLIEPRDSAERIVNAVAGGTPEPGAGVADRATVHVLMAEWSVRMAMLDANDALVTAPAADQAARARDFFTRAVLTAPIVEQSPMTLTGNMRRAMGASLAATTGNDAAALLMALANARAARAAAIASLRRGESVMVDSMSAAVHAGFSQVVEPMPGGELAMLWINDLESIIAALDRQIRLLVAQLARAGDYSEGQPYGGGISPVGPGAGSGAGGRQIAPLRLGVGDLLLTELESSAYEYGDIAHIENVLAGELRRRTYTKTSTAETESFSLTETESTSETDTQTTQRFELEKASQSSLNETLNINAGTSISASYGPMSAQASFGIGSTTARESSQNQGMKLAQEVVSKASQKLRQLSSTSKRTLTRVVVADSTLHEVNNVTPGTDHVVGVYRWVNKLDTLQLRDYGQRLMVGMTIPEPGAYLRWLSRTRVQAGGIAPPTVMRGGVSVPLAPDDLTPDNYLAWVAAYSVADVSPPPAMFITQATGLQHDPSETQESGGFTTRTDTTLTVPPGYRAVAARGTAIAYRFLLNLGIGVQIPAVRIAVGPAIFSWNPPTGPNAESAQSFTLDLSRPGSTSAQGAETSAGAKIPIALNIATNFGFAVTIEIVFERTDLGLRTWQMDAWSKIMVGYANARAAAEDAASRGTLPGITIAGANPLENRNIERTELKRFAIELLAGAVGTLDAVDDDAGARPHPVAARIGDLELLMRVFEDAFEWEHMAWQSLDYFWAPEDSWDALAAISDPDADHKAFLAAGAAKVTIPVRPGFETAVLFRLWTHRLWPGDRAPLPDIPAAVALGAEVATSPKGAPQRGVPVVDGEWVERSPTDLVILQPEGILNWTPPDP